VKFVDKIVFHEGHTILSEMSLCNKYMFYSELPSLGIPIVVLSGLLPIFAVPRFSKQLGVSNTNDLSDVKVILVGRQVPT
jgi:hypothetical protein